MPLYWVQRETVKSIVEHSKQAWEVNTVLGTGSKFHTCMDVWHWKLLLIIVRSGGSLPILGFSFISGVILGKLHGPSVPQFPYL